MAVKQNYLLISGKSLPNNPPSFKTARPDREPLILDLMNENKIDLLFSCLYEHRIRKKLLRKANRGGINIHTAVLPWNKGMHTSFWGIMDGTPLGATIHWMDENLDTGDIVGQAVFEDDAIMTAAEVKQRQLALCVELFESYLPLILRNEAPRVSQPKGGSYHLRRDIEAATTFDDSDTFTMGKLLRLSRATNYGPHGFYIRVGDRKFKIQTSISEVSS